MTDLINQIKVSGIRLGFEPRCVTLMVTLQCTSQCVNCCFRCNPQKTAYIKLKEAVNILNEASNVFPRLSLLVITGGEPFILGVEYLSVLIKHAKSLRLHTRIVSNGFWADSELIAREYLSKLALAGLDELNLSTGDEHSKFVHISNIVHASIESVRLKITTVINIESHINSKINEQSLYEIDSFDTFFKNEDNLSLLKIVNGIWTALNQKKEFEIDESRLKQMYQSKKGCDSILETVSIFPDRTMKACCGLTVNKIRQLSLGKINGFNMRELYDQQLGNFINFWIKIEGPYKVFAYLKGNDTNLKRLGLNHTCQICSYLFNDKSTSKSIEKKYIQKIPDILFKYKIHEQLNNF